MPFAALMPATATVLARPEPMARARAQEMSTLDLGQLRRLRLVALIEGVTLVVFLLVAMPAKHVFGLPLATRVMGPIHGLAFVTYGWMLFAIVLGSSWRRGEILGLMIAAFMPFGLFRSAGLLRLKEASLVAARRCGA